MKYRTHQFHWWCSVHTDTPTSFRCSRESWVSRLVIMAHFRSEQVCLSLAASCLQTRRNWPTWVRDKATFICHFLSGWEYLWGWPEWVTSWNISCHIFPIRTSWPIQPSRILRPPQWKCYIFSSQYLPRYKLSVPVLTDKLSSSPIFSLQPLFLPEGDRLRRWHSATGTRKLFSFFSYGNLSSVLSFRER